jgi:outer membrane protein OmpA-like peptidoglycan-associated protein
MSRRRAHVRIVGRRYFLRSSRNVRANLSVEVGGYTDNVGKDEMNQQLSENRASSVRDYLVQSGVANNSITAKGFGNSQPVASNGSESGRQQNRRVELLVSGELIGSPANATTGSLR